MRADAREVEVLAVDLTRAPGRIQRNAPRALRKGSRLVEAGLRKDATGHRFLAGLPGSVSSGQVAPLAFEIGFDKGGQGSLAHIIVHGSVNNAPVFSNTAALRRSMPAIADLLADEGEDSVLGGAE